MPLRVSKPSLEIAAITGRKEAYRPELKKLLWTYIKNNNLQCEDNETFFVPDEKMAKVFGKGTMRVFSMAKHYRPHLSPIKAKNAQNDSDDEIDFNFKKGEDNLDEAADNKDELGVS